MPWYDKFYWEFVLDVSHYLVQLMKHYIGFIRIYNIPERLYVNVGVLLKKKPQNNINDTWSAVYKWYYQTQNTKTIRDKWQNHGGIVSDQTCQFKEWNCWSVNLQNWLYITKIKWITILIEVEWTKYNCHSPVWFFWITQFLKRFETCCVYDVFTKTLSKYKRLW